MGSAESEQQDPAGNAGSEAAQGESSSEGSHASTFMTILKYVAIDLIIAQPKLSIFRRFGSRIIIGEPKLAIFWRFGSSIFGFPLRIL